MILINANLLLVHFFIMSKFYVFVFLCTCTYCMNCFFIDNVARLLSRVHMCACHVYFTINSLNLLYLYFTARQTRFEERGFSYFGPAAWNTFPSDLHDITDTGTFRKTTQECTL